MNRIVSTGLQYKELWDVPSGLWWGPSGRGSVQWWSGGVAPAVSHLTPRVGL